MPNIPKTQNLGLWLPPPEVYDSDPSWGELLNQNFEEIAEAVPSFNNPLKPSSFLIDQALDFNDWPALNVDYLQLTAHENSDGFDEGSPLRAMYAVGNDLYYNDNNGTPVRIVHDGSVDAGNGNIIGLPSTPPGASVAYANISGFTFLDFNSNFAVLWCGGINLFDGASANGVGLASPSGVPAGWTWTLPSGKPSATSFLQLKSDGTSQYAATTSPVIMLVDTNFIGSGLNYYRDASNRVFISGTVARSSGSALTFMSGSNVLPVGFRPTQTVRFMVPDLNNATLFNVVQFNTDGTAAFLSAPTTGHSYALDGVSFRGT